MDNLHDSNEPVAHVVIVGDMVSVSTGSNGLKELHKLGDGAPLYTTPPQRKPLSNQKIIEMYNEPRSDAEMIEFARAIEAAHGIWPENSDCYGPDWTDRDGEYLK